jgi:hypothetical protein
MPNNSTPKCHFFRSQQYLGQRKKFPKSYKNRRITTIIFTRSHTFLVLSVIIQSTFCHFFHSRNYFKFYLPLYPFISPAKLCLRRTIYMTCPSLFTQCQPSNNIQCRDACLEASSNAVFCSLYPTRPSISFSMLFSKNVVLFLSRKVRNKLHTLTKEGKISSLRLVSGLQFYEDQRRKQKF